MATRTTQFGTGHVGEARFAETQAHRAEIEEQLGRLLSSPLFRNSRHYPALLRHVVEQAIQGQGALLKERSLGIAVFGREPDYDTNLDPVVRASACEVRKRIAQYYHEPGREREVRIDLPTGTYMPEFHFPAPPAGAAVAPEAVLAAVAESGKGRWRVVGAARAHPVVASAAVAVLVALGAATATASLHGGKSALEQFWGPVWNGSDTVLVCIGGRSGLERAQAELEKSQGAPAAVPSALDVMHYDKIAFADGLTMARLSGLIRANGKKFEARRVASLTLTDLRRGPVVLVGAYNNSWTMRLKKNLRYTFEREGDQARSAMVIRDRESPDKVQWRVDDRMPYNKLPEDYAIVSRVVDALTERIVVTVAGMTKDGTAAAGEFVTEERYLAPLVAAAPSDWDRKNVQVVLGTELVNGVPGPARVLAAHYW